MNRLANALLFAVVVMTAFVLEFRATHPQYSPGHLLARVVHKAIPAEAPVYLGELPQPPAFDAVELQQLEARARMAQQVLSRAEVRQAMSHARMEMRLAKSNCKVVRVDQ